jgi:hypothetical protein
MPQDWNENLFQEWIKLRESFKANKRQKNWGSVINICEEIIQLDSKAKFIHIMTPLFYKELANAYEKINDIDNSLRFYEISRGLFIDYRSNNKLKNPNDWIDEITKIEKRMDALLLRSERRGVL